MKKSLILTSALVAIFLLNTDSADAITCKQGYTFVSNDGGFAGCVLTSSIPKNTVSKPAPASTATLSVNPSGFKVGGDQGKVRLTLSTQNYPISSWGSTRLIFQGQDNMCVNHGNHPISGTQTYAEDVTIKVIPPESAGKYDLSAQAFAGDDCTTKVSASALTTVSVSKPCLNCTNEETTSNVTATTTVGMTKAASDTQAREERKKKVDAFLKMYQNDPDFTEIVFLVKLLVSLDIIPI